MDGGRDPRLGREPRAAPAPRPKSSRGATARCTRKAGAGPWPPTPSGSLTSFNEWYEGTQIEPAASYGSRYLDITRQYADLWKYGSNPCSGGIRFAETGKSICKPMESYWHSTACSSSSPISDAVNEPNPVDGKTYLVQYFERARFELHPEHAGTQYEVLLGQLGLQEYNSATPTARPARRTTRRRSSSPNGQVARRGVSPALAEHGRRLRQRIPHQRRATGRPRTAPTGCSTSSVLASSSTPKSPHPLQRAPQPAGTPGARQPLGETRSAHKMPWSAAYLVALRDATPILL